MSDPSWLHAYYVGVDSHLYEVFSSDGANWNLVDLFETAPGALLAYP